MERQRSFSFKSTRILAFVLTISSSLIFLAFFSFWFIKPNPSVYQEPQFQLEKQALNLDLKPTTTVQNLTGLSSNLSTFSDKDKFFIPPHFNATQNATGFEKFLGFEQKSHREKEIAVQEDGVKGNFTSAQKRDVKATSFEVIKLPSRAKGKTREKIVEKSSVMECDVTKGRWVYDHSYPLYTNVTCPFIDEGFNCQNNGRLDRDYMKWRWQPQDCDIPRFNATKMLELIRGKRLVFVGDSINRNQWESVLCMLMGAIKDPKRVYETHGRKITKEKGNYSFRFLDYKCTIEYYVTHFLVHESKARIGQKKRPTLRIDAIDHGSSRWKRADILVFNTAHWWSHYKTKAGINYYQEGNQVHPRLDVSTAFKRALMTWSSWVDKNVNPKKTRVFFRSSAPSHFRGGQWNFGGHCKESTKPSNEISGTSYAEKNFIVEDVIRQMRTPVSFLNISVLSEYRIDGHPSVYGRKFENRRSLSVQDCSHWCLPGVPDTWNELLYFHLLSKR